MIVDSTVDGNAVDATTFACPDPASGAGGGFANTAGIVHNDLADAAAACAAPVAPAKPGVPVTPGTPVVDVPQHSVPEKAPAKQPAHKGPLASTGFTAGQLAIGGVLLLLLGTGAAVAVRRFRTKDA